MTNEERKIEAGWQEFYDALFDWANEQAYGALVEPAPGDQKNEKPRKIPLVKATIGRTGWDWDLVGCGLPENISQAELTVVSGSRGMRIRFETGEEPIVKVWDTYNTGLPDLVGLWVITWKEQGPVFQAYKPQKAQVEFTYDSKDRGE